MVAFSTKQNKPFTVEYSRSLYLAMVILRLGEGEEIYTSAFCTRSTVIYFSEKWALLVRIPF